MAGSWEAARVEEIHVSVEYRVVNPANGEVVSTYPTATDAEVTEAVNRSAAAYPAWSQ